MTIVINGISQYIYIPESSNKGAIFMDDKGKPQISTIGFRALEGRGRCRTWESSKLQFLPVVSTQPIAKPCSWNTNHGAIDVGRVVVKPKGVSG